MSLVSAIKGRLVTDWCNATKWWSVRWNALGAIVLPLMQAVPTMPAEVQALFPVAVRAAVSGLWCIIAIYFRVYAQKRPGA